MTENTTGENIAENSYPLRQINSIKSAVSSHKQTLILGLSSSLNGGAAYGYIISLDYHYFTPALGIVAGLVGGFGVAAKNLFSEKRNRLPEKQEDIPLEDIAMNVIFGTIALLLGYLIVYYFVKFPISSLHGELIRPAEHGTIFEFFKQTLALEDIIAAILGSISSFAIPILFKEKIRSLMKKLKINPFYSASK